MYIHLGGDKIIRSRELVAIFELPGDKPVREQTPSFLTNDVQAGSVEKIGDEEPKSLVVTESKLYYSPISASTLKKRTRSLSG